MAAGQKAKNGSFAKCPQEQVYIMKITKTNSRMNSKTQNKTDRLSEIFNQESNRFAEEFTQSSAASPISQLLELISKLPEIRQEKVTAAKRNIADNVYENQGRLDIAIDRVLEEIITES